MKTILAVVVGAVVVLVAALYMAHAHSTRASEHALPERVSRPPVIAILRSI